MLSITHARHRKSTFMLGQFSRLLIISGILFFLLGVLLAAGSKFGLGQLIGDFTWRKGGTSVYFPIATCIVVSAILTIVLNVVLRFF
ncbi:MAG: DUF2905 domain-containing protein [Abditibacteriaceae bacterium]